MGKTRLNKSFKKRMRFVRLALKLRMILAGEEVRVIPQFNQLRERTVGRCSRDSKSLFGHAVAVFHIEFVAVPMPLHYFVASVDFFRQRAEHNFRWPRAESHAPAFITYATLFFEK